MDILYLAIPCFNEEEVLPETACQLKSKLDDLITNNIVDSKSRILFINDGSTDNTWNIIKNLYNNNTIFSGINLSRNRGHQNALLAGLMISKNYADIVISLDADLQDDISIIDEMIHKYHNGNDIVYGVRSSRDTDSFFKKTTAEFFYNLMKHMGVQVVFNHADYRLMSKRALEELSKYKEVNLFLRGIVPLIGFKSTNVYYERHERYAGNSKYPLKKMLAFALDGITSFSIKPIRIITSIGFIIFIISIFALLYLLCLKFFGYTVQGWTGLMVSIWLLGGIQLLCLGTIGEYVGKIYFEVKARPRYTIDEFLNR